MLPPGHNVPVGGVRRKHVQQNEMRLMELLRRFMAGKHALVRATIAPLLLCISLPRVGQNRTMPRSAGDVVEAYRRMDANGERLTESGWFHASGFFVRPGLRPRHSVVGVMESESIEVRPVATGNTVKVHVGRCAHAQIDASGRFTFRVLPYLLDPFGDLRKPEQPQIHGPHAPLGMVYNLVLTDTHWER